MHNAAFVLTYGMSLMHHTTYYWAVGRLLLLVSGYLQLLTSIKPSNQVSDSRAPTAPVIESNYAPAYLKLLPRKVWHLPFQACGLTVVLLAFTATCCQANAIRRQYGELPSSKIYQACNCVCICMCCVIIWHSGTRQVTAPQGGNLNLSIAWHGRVLCCSL